MAAKKKRNGLQTVLGKDERLLWSGRPPQGVMFRNSDLLFIPISLLWGGFACFWTLLATTSGGCFGLFGVPFVLVGAYMVFGRFYADALQRSNTYYAVTNERILISTGLMGNQLKSLNLSTLTELTLDLKADGRGTIAFGPAHPVAAWYRGTPWPGAGKYYSPTFEMIDEARDVYEQIREAQKDAVEFRATRSRPVDF